MNTRQLIRVAAAVTLAFAATACSSVDEDDEVITTSTTTTEQTVRPLHGTTRTVTTEVH